MASIVTGQDEIFRRPLTHSFCTPIVDNFHLHLGPNETRKRYNLEHSLILFQIYEGTAQIQRMIIGRELIDKAKMTTM